MTSRDPLLLSYRTLGMGDLLTAIPALRALRRRFPGHLHVLATSPWLTPLAGLIDAVDTVLPVPELGTVPAQAAGVDVAVNLHGSGPQSHRTLLEQRPRRFIAYHHPEIPATAEGPRWREREHEVARWCRLLADRGIPADPTDLHLQPPGGARGGPDTGPFVVHPGAKAPARRWPAERFSAVAALLAESGHVVVTGSPEERDLATEVARHAGLPASSVLAGRTDLMDLARAVDAARLVVSGDTGVAHLATALATPSVVLFGPTSPDEWGPPEHLRARHRALWAGGSGDPLGDEPHRGLLDIAVDDVIREVSDLLSTMSQRRG